MPTIKQVTYIDAPIEKVFAFHLDLNNLLKISPPETDLQIFHMPDKMVEGATVGLFVKMGPITTTMETVIDELDPPHKFVDRQIGGFFSKWTHTHLLEKITETKTKLTDIIEFSLPMGILGNLFGGGIVQDKIEKIFRHRAMMTRKFLEGDSD